MKKHKKFWIYDFNEKKALFLGRFGIWTNEMKYYVWGRKIGDMVEILKNTGQEKGIKPYLKKCVYYRKKFLRYPLTKVEKNNSEHIDYLMNYYKIL